MRISVVEAGQVDVAWPLWHNAALFPYAKAADDPYHCHSRL